MIKKFPAKKTTDEIKGLLKDLETEHQPGELSGDVSKTELLETMKDTIKDLTTRGYTVQQIAEAINKHDSFNILPKSITQMLNNAEKKKPARAKRKPSTKQAVKSATEPSMQKEKNPESKAGTFEIKPDTDDL